MVDLSRVDQFLAFASPEIQSIPFPAVEREPGDGQRLTLSTGFLDPIIRPPGPIFAVPNFGNDALKAGLACVHEHLVAIDFKALAELYIRARDQMFEMRLALNQWELPQIVSVEIKQIERDHYDLS